VYDDPTFILGGDMNDSCGAAKSFLKTVGALIPYSAPTRINRKLNQVSEIDVLASRRCDVMTLGHTWNKFSDHALMIQ